MPLLTIAEAARRAKVDASTIHRQIKKGVLSAARAPDGRRGIDPAELARVYPESARTMAEATADSGQAHESARVEQLQTTVSQLQARVDELERDKRWLQGQMERLLPPPKRSWVDRLGDLVQRLRGK
jgi:hypothetical protein